MALEKVAATGGTTSVGRSRVGDGDSDAPLRADRWGLPLGVRDRLPLGVDVPSVVSNVTPLRFNSLYLSVAA